MVTNVYPTACRYHIRKTLPMRKSIGSVSSFLVLGAYISRMVIPKPPERAMRSFMTVLAVTFLRVMV